MEENTAAGSNGQPSRTNTRPLSKKDLAALCDSVSSRVMRSIELKLRSETRPTNNIRFRKPKTDNESRRRSNWTSTPSTRRRRSRKRPLAGSRYSHQPNQQQLQAYNTPPSQQQHHQQQQIQPAPQYVNGLMQFSPAFRTPPQEQQQIQPALQQQLFQQQQLDQIQSQQLPVYNQAPCWAWLVGPPQRPFFLFPSPFA